MNDLGLANEKKRRMHEELARVIYGVDKVSDVLYRDDDACQDLYLFDLLRAAFGSMRGGHRRAYRVMTEMHVVAYRRVRGLRDSQKEWLVRRFG